jgi:hypothetical protein
VVRLSMMASRRRGGVLRCLGAVDDDHWPTSALAACWR